VRGKHAERSHSIHLAGLAQGCAQACPHVQTRPDTASPASLTAYLYSIRATLRVVCHTGGADSRLHSRWAAVSLLCQGCEST
jgi:hypothetical protein